MNFIPKDLKVFLEDYKRIHNKILNATLGITDLNFHGECNNTFELDFSRININDNFSFLLVISDLFISFSEDSGRFTISLITKDKNSNVEDHGKFYTGVFENRKYRNLHPITTRVILNKPVTIILKINFNRQVSSVFNVGVTINQ